MTILSIYLTISLLVAILFHFALNIAQEHGEIPLQIQFNFELRPMLRPMAVMLLGFAWPWVIYEIITRWKHND